LLVLAQPNNQVDSFWKSFVPQGIGVVQLVEIRKDIQVQMSFAQFFEAISKDVRIDPKNVFVIDIMGLVSGSFATAFGDPAGFRGMISIGQCAIPTPPKT